jgi:hypothetical protein
MNLPSQTVMIERYKGYLIHGTARAMPDSPEWRSEGTVFVQRGQGSVIQIQHLEGAIFEDRQLAEAHGLALCMKWIDKRS